MGLAPEAMLVVKRTFLEFVQSPGSKGPRGRAFTDTALLGSSDDSSSEASTTLSAADAAELSSDEPVQESPFWPATPVLEAQDRCSEWWQGQELVNVEATSEVKAVLGMAGGGIPAPPQPLACWWLPPDLAWSLDACGGELPAAEQVDGYFGDASMFGAPAAAAAAITDVAEGSPAGAAGATAAVADGCRTTIMIRKLPDCCSRDMLQEVLDKKGFAGEYDFLYVPVDFGTGNGLGYAFVNLVSPAAAARAWSAFEGVREEDWPVPSQEACTVCWSDPTQGLAAHLERYRSSPVMHHTVPDAWKPATFIGGARVAFPPPTKAIKAPKPPRSRRAAQAA